MKHLSRENLLDAIRFLEVTEVAARISKDLEADSLRTSVAYLKQVCDVSEKEYEDHVEKRRYKERKG